MLWLKQSTAITVKIGPFLDEDDGKTAETGLTISQADVRLSKNGGDIAQKNESTACTHDELGIYGCPLDTTDTNTLGRLQLWVHESGALPAWHEFMVVPSNVWDSFFGADYLQVDVIQVEGSDATDQITASVPTAAAIRAEIDSNSTQLAAIVADTNELQTDDVPGLIAALNDPTAADIRTEIDSNSTQLAAIVADTNELQTDDVPGLIAALNDPTAAAIADAVWEEAIADHSGTGGSTAEALAGASAPTAAQVADAVWEEAIADHSGTGGSTAEALDNASAPTAAQVADAVWDEAATGHTDAGKAGAQLWTDVDAILADTNELQTDDVPGLIAALNDPTAAAIADAVWDEALAAHDTEDTVGNVLNDLTEESDGTYRFTSAALAQAPSGAGGAGAITFTYTLTSSVDASPIADADVWATSDQAGTNVLASGTTDSSGQVTFYLDAGTVYIWRQKSGWNFTNPDTETVA